MYFFDSIWVPSSVLLLYPDLYISLAWTVFFSSCELPVHTPLVKCTGRVCARAWSSLEKFGFGVCSKQRLSVKPFLCWRPHQLKLGWGVTCVSVLQAGWGRHSFGSLAGGFLCLRWDGNSQGPPSATLPCAADTLLPNSWESVKENT